MKARHTDLSLDGSAVPSRVRRRLGHRRLDDPCCSHDHSSHASQAQGLTQSDLRALLGRQLGEHAALAMNATNLGVIGSPAFPAAAKALDRNSVALSKSIAASTASPQARRSSTGSSSGAPTSASSSTTPSPSRRRTNPARTRPSRT